VTVLAAKPESNEQLEQETGVVAKACQILLLLERQNMPLRLTDVAHVTGINKATCYRILKCLVAQKLAAKSLKSEYSGVMQRREGRLPIKIGYAAQADEFAFSRAVTAGIEASAMKAGIDLITVNNGYDPAIALRNADRLIEEKVQLVIEFQTDASIAALISAKVKSRHLPMIAIEIPHPNAVYFGINNAQAGLTAGRSLAGWAIEHWRGQVDMLVLLGLPIAGSLPGSRLTCTLMGIREVIPDFNDEKVMFLNGNGRYKESFAAVQKMLKTTGARRILVSAMNDPSALGALQAFRDVGREAHCAVMGQNASSEAVEEMRSSSTRLIGSVGYFPEKYGEQVVKLAIEMIEGRQTPPSVFVKHQLVTPANVQGFYPLPLPQLKQKERRSTKR
jgi:ribose transport system substrate-binding protein